MKRRRSDWLRDLADGAWASAILQRPRELQEVIEREARQRGLEPWELTRQIARRWLADGRIESLEVR
jgi:hypothetical protein